MSEEIEEWRPVVGLEGRYAVSSFGRVLSLDRRAPVGGGATRGVRERLLKPKVTSTGYHAVMIGTTAADRKRRQIHRLVAAAFFGDPIGDATTVNHKDGCKTNNRVENLEYMTVGDNVRHAFATGLVKTRARFIGESNPNSKLKRHEAMKVLEMSACGMRTYEIARMTGYPIPTVSDLCLNRSWKHLPREFEWQRTAAMALETMSTTLGRCSTTASNRTPVDDS